MAITKVSKLNKVKQNTSRFLKEIRNELKKVIWPNRKQLINNTATVLLSCLFIGAILWILDLGLGEISKLVFAR